MPYLFFEVIHQISRSYGLKNQWFELSLKKITRLVTAIKSLRFALFIFMQNDETKPTWESFSFIVSFLWSTFSVSETQCDLDFLKLTHLLLLISLCGHWIQEISKLSIHVKPLIKAVLIIQSLWLCFLSIVPNHEWYDIFQTLCFLLISIWMINHFELV